MVNGKPYCRVEHCIHTLGRLGFITLLFLSYLCLSGGMDKRGANLGNKNY